VKAEAMNLESSGVQGYYAMPTGQYLPENKASYPSRTESVPTQLRGTQIVRKTPTRIFTTLVESIGTPGIYTYFPRIV
jgi:hypothetical protein